MVGADVMGRCRLPAGQVSSGQPLSQWCHLHSEDDPRGESKGELRVSVHFTPSEAEAAEVLSSGFEGVKAAYFPMRRGGRVRLYQDSCVWEHFNPRIELEGGVAYQPAQCWRDICQ